MFDVLFQCLGEDYNIVEVEKSEVPLYLGDNDVCSASKSFGRIAESKEHSDELV